jgi:hypothetical protein
MRREAESSFAEPLLLLPPGRLVFHTEDLLDAQLIRRIFFSEKYRAKM